MLLILFHQNFATKITKKGAKKGEFKDPLDLALGSAGGNKSSLKCEGKSNEINKVIDSLEACPATIEAACNKTAESATLTKLEKCFNATKSYR